MTTCSVGIDLGTSGVKVIAIATDGAVLASASGSFDFDCPRADQAETPPSRSWDATAKAARALTTQLSEKLAARADTVSVGLSGQMHGSVFLDAAALERAGQGPIGRFARR